MKGNMVTDTTIKKGYKQTEIGVIPEDWEVKELGELVEVKVRAPTSSEPQAVIIAECSLSTATYSAFSSPLSTNAESISVRGVWGVIG